MEEKQPNIETNTIEGLNAICNMLRKENTDLKTELDKWRDLAIEERNEKIELRDKYQQI